jgi:hypothetical protein
MAERFQLQHAQVLAGQAMTPAAIESAIKGGLALAAVEGDRIYGMAGIYEVWPDRGLAWALLAQDAGSKMLVLHRLAQRALDVCPLRRVEADVLDTHEEGHRWMRLLGFRNEGMRRRYWQGADYALYARVR